MSERQLPSSPEHQKYLSDVEVEIAKEVLSRFLNLKQSTPRKELVIRFRNPEVLDDLVRKSIFECIDRDGKQAYRPKLLAFHYCGGAEIVTKARSSLETVLNIFQSLFVSEPDDKQFSPEEIEVQARKIYGAIDPDSLKLGLYLVREFNFLGSYGTNPDGTQVAFVCINERIVTMNDPSQEWDERVRILSQYLIRSHRSEEAKPVEGLSPSFLGQEVILADGTSETEDEVDEEKAPPRAFVSYSWDSPGHREWVFKFATRLQTEGVEVVLDRWHLRRGADRTAFMEKSIAQSDFVILICTPKYADRANERKGGVGYEALIITGELADKIDSEKFIPVLREGEFESSSPCWIKNRLGVDLRGEPYRQDEYEDLLRTLHREPVGPPPIGPKPSWQAVNADQNRPTATILPTSTGIEMPRIGQMDHDQWDENARLAKGMVLEGACPLSAEKRGDRVLILISSFGALFNEKPFPVYYNSGSISMSAKNATVYIFALDPERRGGATTYQATLVRREALAGNEKVYIGSIRLP
jgi:hypothetical protein